ncbi:ArdC family protein [Mannheimia haemolytica]|nr:ArdC family protein [Mannheimia haemolytica]MDW1150085.1 ArdC family protein [Mannheimia haemolytica]MDW1160296.1 ArdC family protein [Mannheimia haemolytica]UQX78986.1 ArdC family protein [Mannheimia haemolytica]
MSDSVLNTYFKHALVKAGFPDNRLYSGINTLLLWIATAEHGYKQCKWITAKKANELGGYIRKGEKATVVMNYRPDERETR